MHCRQSVCLVVLVLLLENEPVLLGSSLRVGSWSSSGLDIGGLVLSNSVSVDLLARNSRLGWHLEWLDGVGVRSNHGWLELLDLLDVQFRNQVVASWSRSKQSSGRQSALVVSMEFEKVIGRVSEYEIGK